MAILAGGLGTRMRPLARKVPKALFEIEGEPFIGHQLRLLARNGLRNVVICAGYLGSDIEARVGDGSQYGVAAAYSFDGPTLLGTGGAVKNALPLLGEAFLVLYGDSLLPCDYVAVQDAFERSGKLALMTVFCNDGRWDTSNVEFANGELLRYDKSHPDPSMRHIDYGLGAFTRAAVEIVPPNEPSDLATLYQELLRRHQLEGYEVSQRFYEVGSPAGLEETRRYLRNSQFSIQGAE